MNADNFMNLLTKLGACRKAEIWAACKTSEEIYKQCTNGHWLIWLICNAGLITQRRVFIAAQCARLALHSTSDPRVLACINACEAWSRGEISDDSLREARRAATTAGGHAAAHAAAAAFYVDAAVDAFYVDAAVDAAAYAAVDAKIQAQCADIIRQHLSFEEFESLLVTKYGEYEVKTESTLNKNKSSN